MATEFPSNADGLGSKEASEAQFLVQLLAPLLGDKNNVVLALPFRVA
jgi:hypothetical protein